LFVAGALLGAAAIIAWLVTRGEARHRTRALPQEPWVSVTMSEPLLQTLIHESLGDSELAARIMNVRVDARPGAVVVTGTIEVFGRRLVATATARPHVSSEQLQLAISDLRVGQLTLPFGSVLERALEAQVRMFLHDADLVITGVEVASDGVTITARHQRPRQTQRTTLR
jgi:uncharacterized protein YpmS